METTIKIKYAYEISSKQTCKIVQGGSVLYEHTNLNSNNLNRQIKIAITISTNSTMVSIIISIVSTVVRFQVSTIRVSNVDAEDLFAGVFIVWKCSDITPPTNNTSISRLTDERRRRYREFAHCRSEYRLNQARSGPQLSHNNHLNLNVWRLLSRYWRN